MTRKNKKQFVQRMKNASLNVLMAERLWIETELLEEIRELAKRRR